MTDTLLPLKCRLLLYADLCNLSRDFSLIFSIIYKADDKTVKKSENSSGYLDEAGDIFYCSIIPFGIRIDSAAQNARQRRDPFAVRSGRFCFFILIKT